MMATVAVIGEEALVRGFALAGVLVLPAEEPAAARAAARRLPDEVGLLLLTPAAADALAAEETSTWPLRAVIPEAGP